MGEAHRSGSRSVRWLRKSAYTRRPRPSGKQIASDPGLRTCKGGRGVNPMKRWAKRLRAVFRKDAIECASSIRR